jgi:hypothetical protein
MDSNATTARSKLGNMEFQNFAGLAHTLQTAAIAALIFAACAYIPKLKYRAQLAKLPVFSGANGGEKHRQGYLNSAKVLYKEGYQKVSIRSFKLCFPLTRDQFKDCVFLMTTSDGMMSTNRPDSGSDY